MSLDRFGSARNRLVSQKRGKPGLSGILEQIKWMPNTLIKKLSEKWRICIFLDNEKYFKKTKNGIIEWISKNKKILKGEIPSKEMLKIHIKDEFKNVLPFKKNRYTNDSIYLLPNLQSTYGFICITFRTDIDLEQILITNVDENSNDDIFYHEIRLNLLFRKI